MSVKIYTLWEINLISILFERVQKQDIHFLALIWEITKVTQKARSLRLFILISNDKIVMGVNQIIRSLEIKHYLIKSPIKDYHWIMIWGNFNKKIFLVNHAIIHNKKITTFHNHITSYIFFSNFQSLLLVIFVWSIVIATIHSLV